MNDCPFYGRMFLRPYNRLEEHSHFIKEQTEVNAKNKTLTRLNVKTHTFSSVTGWLWKKGNYSIYNDLK